MAVPASAEVTYIWGAGPDEAAMRTAYGKQMPAHCAEYFGSAQGTRRLSCLRLSAATDLAASPAVVIRLGSPDADGGQRLFCTCAPVYDYSGREVARVGVFGHGPDDAPHPDGAQSGRVGARAPRVDAARVPAGGRGRGTLTGRARGAWDRQSKEDDGNGVYHL